MSFFGAFIQCEGCKFECNICEHNTIAEVRFWAKHQAKICGDTIKMFKPYKFESEDKVRVLLVGL